jgi:SAM-dependent methyltransferase
MTSKIAKNLTQEYWDKLLSENTSLKGVGWPNWPESYNLILYKKYLKGFEDVINSLQNKYKFSLNKDLNIFEIGPGSGFYTNYFFQAGIRNYIGVDISEASVNKLKSNYPLYKFLRNDISINDSFVNENENKFDLVCVVDVLLHITDDDKFRNAVKNLCLILKQGGYIIIGDAISVFRKTSHSEGSKYTHDISRHIDYIEKVFSSYDVKVLEIYHRHNFLLNKNFDFKYPIFEILVKPFFYLLNGGLSVFRNSDFVGKIVGYPLSFLDSLITPFQKYSKNSKFLLLRKQS